MKNFLTQDDVSTIEARLKTFEEKTSCELLLILTKSSDEYPAAPWRFGVIFGTIITFLFSLFFEFHHAYFWPILTFILIVLGTWIGSFHWAKKLTLNEIEIQRESAEKALECFHTMGTSQVSHKVTAMIMVSLLEKSISILVDKKLKEKISEQDLNQIVEVMKNEIKTSSLSLGYLKSIELLEEKILHGFGGKVSDVSPSELKDTVIFL